MVMKGDISAFETFLYSQGIVTAPRQLHKAVSATISPNEYILGAFEILVHLLKGDHLYQMPFWRYRDAASAKIYLVETWYKNLRTLLSIVSQPWWVRVWIVQEAVLSPNAILNIGPHQVRLSSFLSAFMNFEAHSSSCCNRWTHMSHGQLDEISRLYISKTPIVRDLGNLIDAYAANNLVPLRLALSSRNRKATDPRDHIYALSALMKTPYTGLPLGPAPDYRLAPEQLFREQTLGLMKQSGRIDLLDYAIGVDNPNPLGLPSWVCDWSRSERVAWVFRFYNACNGQKHHFHHASGEEFIIAGTVVGVVSRIGDVMTPNNADDIEVKIEQWRNLAEAAEPFDTITVLRTAILDSTLSREDNQFGRRLTSGDVALLEELWRQWIVRLKLDRETPDDLDRYSFRGNFQYHVTLNRVFATREGHLGSSPCNVCVGDRIFIVQGAQVPVVLRALNDNSTEADPPELCRHYAYVGSCYVRGCVDGEAVTPETKWQTLHLH